MRLIFIGRSKGEVRNIGLVSPPRWWLKLGHDHFFQGVKKMGPVSNDREQQYFRVSKRAQVVKEHGGAWWSVGVGVAYCYRNEGKTGFLHRVSGCKTLWLKKQFKGLKQFWLQAFLFLSA